MHMSRHDCYLLMACMLFSFLITTPRRRAEAALQVACLHIVYLVKNHPGDLAQQLGAPGKQHTGLINPRRLAATETLGLQARSCDCVLFRAQVQCGVHESEQCSAVRDPPDTRCAPGYKADARCPDSSAGDY